MSMEHTLEFLKQNKTWLNEFCSQADSIREKWAPPFYLFNGNQARSNIRELRQKLGGGRLRLAYTMKTNPWLAHVVADEADYLEVCSEGELNLCISCGISSKKIVLDGVWRSDSLVHKALERQVARFCIDSVDQMKQLLKIHCGKQTLSILLRVSSGNRFGLDRAEVKTCLHLCEHRNDIKIVGIQYYPGTQRCSGHKVQQERSCLSQWLDFLAASGETHIQEILFGAGIGIPYFMGEEEDAYFEAFQQCADFIKKLNKRYLITYEAGRAVAASSGIYVTEVFGQKRRGDKNLLFCRGGTNHIQYHGGILGLRSPKIKALYARTSGKERPYTICGSLCSEDDILAKDVLLDEQIAPKDLLIFCCAGAYAPVIAPVLFLMMEMPHILMYNQSGNSRLNATNIYCMRGVGPAYRMFDDRGVEQRGS